MGNLKLGKKMKLLAATMVGIAAAQDSGCATGMGAVWYSDATCETVWENYPGAVYAPTDETVGCYNPLANLAAVTEVIADEVAEEGATEEETTEGGRRLQDEVEEALEEIGDAIEEAVGDALAALTMSIELRCGNKVRFTTYASDDCTGDLFVDPENEDTPNPMDYEWDACTPIPGDDTAWVVITAGEGQDTETDVTVAAAGAMALKGAFAIAAIAASLY